MKSKVIGVLRVVYSPILYIYDYLHLIWLLYLMFGILLVLDIS